jgi:hypothetical protein
MKKKVTPEQEEEKKLSFICMYDKARRTTSNRNTVLFVYKTMQTRLCSKIE